MKKFVARFFVCLILVLLLSPRLFSSGFSDKVRSFTLPNGMTFFVYERHFAPTFAGMIMVKVGSADERAGETGIAHFIEHLMSKGTPVIGTKDYVKEKPILDEMDKIGDELAAESLKGTAADQVKIKALRDNLKLLQEETLKYAVKDEIDKLYTENGGSSPLAGTLEDGTGYFVKLPSNRLELWFLIESERFKNPVFREFYSQRDVIGEERRRGEDNNPDGFLREQFTNIAYTLHPYRHSVSGFMEDIQSYTKAKALNFYRTFYIPNNMKAAIVGDVKLEDVKSLAEKYFGDMPKGGEPPRPIFVEPRQKGERRVTLKFEAEPRLEMGFHAFAPTERGSLALSLMSSILSSGDSSRMVRDLVTNRKLALYISTSPRSHARLRYASLFEVSGVPRYPHTTEELERAIYEHLDRLKKEPVTKEEIEKALNQIEASLFRPSEYGEAQNIFLAKRLLWNVVLYDDPDWDFKQLEKMRTVTPEEIMAVANQVFVESNRTVGILLRKEKEGEK